MVLCIISPLFITILSYSNVKQFFYINKSTYFLLVKQKNRSERPRLFYEIKGLLRQVKGLLGVMNLGELYLGVYISCVGGVLRKYLFV